MRTYTSNKEAGRSIAIIGPTGSGKTCSARTIDKNCLFINVEPKNPVDDIGRDNIKYVGFESFNEGIVFGVLLNDYIKQTGQCEISQEFLDKVREELGLNHDIMKLEKPFPLEVIMMDSISYYQRIQLDRIEEENDITKEESIRKGLKRPLYEGEQFSMNWDGWQAIASMMMRILNLYCTFTDYGINVIVTVSAEFKQGDVNLLLDGQKFPPKVYGYFNGVGILLPNVGESPYPPRITFSKTQGYECAKPPCDSLATGVYSLDWEEIFKEIKRNKK